jgi:amino acid transporter
VVGATAIGICVFSLLPFLIMVLVGIWKVDWERLGRLPEGGLPAVDWSAFINILFWNCNYYDNVASFAGEVQDPGRTYPRAMAIAVATVTLTTALPLMVGIGATAFPDCMWTDGFFATVRTVSHGLNATDGRTN